MTSLSYAHGVGPTPLLGETIGANLRQTVERFGEREALVVPHQGYRATYRDLWDQSGRLARGLMALGVGKGDRVGIWAPNRYEWVIVQYATARIGAILVNVNTAYRSAELEYALNQSGVSVLILAPGFRATDYVAMLAEIRERCPALRESVVLGEAAGGSGGKESGEQSWDALLAGGDRIGAGELAAREGELQFDEPINIQYTSGTTGFPKGATLSHHNILNNGFFVAETMRYTERDRVCVPNPFYHCFGMVLGNLGSTSHGACIVVPGESFDPLAVMTAVQEERCTALYGAPTMFIAELEHPRFPEFDLSSLRTGIMAGSPCPVEVMKKVRSLMHMTEITICYGMTETAPVSTQTTVDAPLEKRVGTVGAVHPHVEVKIIDPDGGGVLPRGGAGELCTRGYCVMLGYWNNEEATRTAIDAGRWMHTGDLATMDADGYINIVGRIKDMVIRGGENIYPREVEEFLYGHPAISDVQVIGVPSEKYGEEVMAWVRLKPGAAATGDELAEYCRGRIATFKIPRYWKFVDGFPMTVTGKIQKFRMRELAVAELRLEPAAGTRTA
ncbi:MAG: AMP-binding protein [Candidatus Dormibacteraceae bacterium]